MRKLASALAVAVVLMHLAFMLVEMLLWDHPFGRRLFSMTPGQSAATAVLAFNQGLYNGFLAAGLAWGLWRDRLDLKVFFLGCVILAGLVGGLSAKPSILLVQALPAVLALAAVLAARRRA